MFAVYLLAEFSVNGKHLRVTYKSKCQDGDGIRRLQIKSHRNFTWLLSRKHMNSKHIQPCAACNMMHPQIVSNCTRVLSTLLSSEQNPSQTNSSNSAPDVYVQFISDLLVDGEELGGACVLWQGSSHRVVAKNLQRASNVKFLVDDLM